MGQYLNISKDRHIIRMVLSRGDKHNAFDANFIQEITDAFREAGTDQTARCVYLTAAGPSFCAGADLNWMKESRNFSKTQNVSDAEKLYEMFEAVRACEIPVIAKVHGNVFGGGLGLVAACDIAAADRSAKFAFSEVKLGLVPAVISSYVIQKCNYRLAAEYMLSGQTFEGPVAFQMGLINHFEPELQVNKYLDKQIEAFASLGPEAVRETKKLIIQIKQNEISNIKKHCTELIAEKRVSTEGQEGLAAFFEKRKASWVLKHESED